MHHFFRFENCNRKNWRDGPWNEEPDKVQWVQSGLDCLIVRNKELGHLCGYVGVGPKHPFFGVDYTRLIDSIVCHGGLTFSGFCQTGKEPRICHDESCGVANARVWWLGFDCGHGGDFFPIREVITLQGEYRNLKYVSAVTSKMAMQLALVEQYHKRNIEPCKSIPQ